MYIYRTIKMIYNPTFSCYFYVPSVLESLKNIILACFIIIVAAFILHILVSFVYFLIKYIFDLVVKRFKLLIFVLISKLSIILIYVAPELLIIIHYYGHTQLWFNPRTKEWVKFPLEHKYLPNGKHIVVHSYIYRMTELFAERYRLHPGRPNSTLTNKWDKLKASMIIKLFQMNKADKDFSMIKKD